MALLETHGLTARYGDFKALFGVDFAIEAGETVAIIGANGAGKSTFLRAICGLLAAERAIHSLRWRRHRRRTASRDRAARHRHGAGRAQAFPFAER